MIWVIAIGCCLRDPERDGSSGLYCSGAGSHKYGIVVVAVAVILGCLCFGVMVVSVVAENGSSTL